MSEPGTFTYAEGILAGFDYLLQHHDEVMILGQGLWSPWYVGSSMTDLDKRFGRHRVMDTPVSEDATTAIAAGLSLSGYRPVVVHPRLDFMVLASNSIVNQIANWSHMLGGQSKPNVTIRGIINRGGEQGAQHSQSLHSWFAHIPGLRVVMPATALDARDLLIASVLSDDPVLYIDDRWCYEVEDDFEPIEPKALSDVRPGTLREGQDITIVGAGHSSQVALQVARHLAEDGIESTVVDLRVVNPLDSDVIEASVRSTGRLVAIDGSWRTCGLAGEVLAGAVERLPLGSWKATPQRFSLPAAPAPTSKALEDIYYHSPLDLAAQVVSHQFANGHRR